MKKEKQPKAEQGEKKSIFAKLFKKKEKQPTAHVHVTRFHALASEGGYRLGELRRVSFYVFP